MILWPYGKFFGSLVYFSCFGVLYQDPKSGNPGARTGNKFKITLHWQNPFQEQSSPKYKQYTQSLKDHPTIISFSLSL
jgi:hypothetical protein